MLNTNALQIGLQRNVSTGLLISANYELSHSLDNGGIGGGEAAIPQDVSCHICEYSSSDQDMRHYFSASSIWRVPIGRGRAYLANASRVTDALIGGWQVSGIDTARSGLPLNVTVSRSASDLGDQLNRNQRPNRVVGVPLYLANRTAAKWLNPSAFSQPSMLRLLRPATLLIRGHIRLSVVPRALLPIVLQCLGFKAGTCCSDMHACPRHECTEAYRRRSRQRSPLPCIEPMLTLISG